ncbi:MAG: hypothetical protein ACOYJ6_12765 [Caulobacterales bacterium]
MNLRHLHALSDDTGILQHGVFGLADRTHGYCVDDNARALLVCLALELQKDDFATAALADRYAAFLHHAWNPDAGRFRNFMDYSRNWLDAWGSEDCHGRAVWALGACASLSTAPAKRAWAVWLIEQALAAPAAFQSPRAWAFTLLGIDALGRRHALIKRASDLRAKLAAALLNCLAHAERADWAWFEGSLSYDNARLCQALIVTGQTLSSADLVDAGLRTLRWLLSVQLKATGPFVAVGTHGFGALWAAPAPFDQQPLEAAAMIAACAAAARVDPTFDWRSAATKIFAWFHGDNMIGQSLIDPEDGACCDGLHPDRVNQNRGAESILSYLLAACDMKALTSTSVGP